MDQADQLRFLMNQSVGDNEPAAGFQPRVVAVASGKGGVGKSNFCVNFAIGLQQANHHPIVIDADVGFADVEVLLGIRPRKTIVDVIQGTSIWEALEYDSNGLPFLSAGNGLVDLHELSNLQMDRLLREMTKLQEKHDIILIDCGAGLGKNLSKLLAAADDLILVTTPEPTAIADCYALIKMLALRGELPTTQLVINRVRNMEDGKFTADKLQLVANRFLDLNLAVLGYIHEDTAVPNAVRQQAALLTAYPNSPAARSVKQIVKSYLHIEPSGPRKGISGFIERMFRRRSGGEFDSSHPA